MPVKKTTAAAPAAESVSWLRLPAPPQDDRTDALFEHSVSVRGYIRNTQSVLAHIPALVLAQEALSRSVTIDFTDGLTGRERELIALAVSVQNRCEPCVWGHAAKLREITGNPRFVGLVEVNYRRADLTPRERAIVDYAVLITERPWTIEPADLDGLRAAGLSEREILEAAAIAAYFNFSNRVNSALGVHPNPEPFDANR
ncbi:peroxidase-related enzyme [Azospirillum sp. Vi22]|uniref:peroxidase-related enzyme n=1 Tax=Azospirillum baldaniorum TaxID=1064539 RepID=UPI00157B4845|nr:peroxidase-related enzyme [Azospirillum baldaniorum]NUB06735.1 peroxidase-related enzyme [Azospirillum baldaniorum]